MKGSCTVQMSLMPTTMCLSSLKSPTPNERTIVSDVNFPKPITINIPLMIERLTRINETSRAGHARE